MDPTTIVDTHVHICEISDKSPIYSTSPTWNSYPDEPGMAEELLADMDANGVDWTVLMQASWSTLDNGYIADSMAQYPNRFIGHGLIDSLIPDNAHLFRLPESGCRHRDTGSAARHSGSEHEHGALSPERRGVIYAPLRGGA